jgi:molybdate transport system substrate-binding protein
MTSEKKDKRYFHCLRTLRGFIAGLLMVLIIGMFCGTNVYGTELTVFAGSASQPPLQEAAKAFTYQTGVKIALHLGGSGAMLSQLELSNAADIYMPGSPDYMEKAKRRQVVVPTSETLIAYLVPAINVPVGNPHNIQSLKDLTRSGLRVGMAEPDGVCVGLYAVEILDHAGLIEAIKSNLATRVASCARTAGLIPLRAVDATLGWRVFSHWNDQIESVALRPEEIVRLAYIPVAIARDSRQRETAQEFIHFLAGPQGRAIFSRWGYITSEDEAREFAPDARIGGEYILPETW